MTVEWQQHAEAQCRRAIAQMGHRHSQAVPGLPGQAVASGGGVAEMSAVSMLARLDIDA